MKIFYTASHQAHDPAYEGYTATELLPAFEKSARATEVMTVLSRLPWAMITPPHDFGLAPILAVHTETYLTYLRTAYAKWQPYSPVEGLAFIPGTDGIDYPTASAMSGSDQYGFFLLDTTVTINSQTYLAAIEAAQCAISGAQALLEGDQAAFAICRPPGHHAGREICGGYCFLNNAAIAANHLSHQGKVAILDIDFHAGNGTQAIFYERNDVFVISLHADPVREYPHYAGYAHEAGLGAGCGFHRNFPLTAGINDHQYLNTLKQATQLIRTFDPEYLVVSAGMDIYEADPLGDFKITRPGIAAIGQEIAGLGLPTLIVMEGGYHIPSLGENFASLLAAF